MVYVLDKRKKPLMPCSHKRARQFLERGRARVHKRIPFTIRLVDRLQQDSVLQPLTLKIDPGSKTTGIARVPEAGPRAEVVSLIELEHRGEAIKKKLKQRAAFGQLALPHSALQQPRSEKRLAATIAPASRRYHAFAS